jgi:hypothetical protein
MYFDFEEFYLYFSSTKSNKFLVFTEPMSDFPRQDEHIFHDDSFDNEHIFLISSLEPWYGYILIYLQTLNLPQHILRDDRRRIRAIKQKTTSLSMKRCSVERWMLFFIVV